ncbi:hypothetical protein I4U23_023248 [Adineta vaga]|nr:hypothetical protein I4U23_023248 [Adineta vaga]
MMNISYVVLSILIISIGISECSNETSIVPSERVASNCYFCSNCPRPFNPYASTVSQVYSSTGWCTMMSRDSSPDGVYTRGVAVPGLCTYNGCAWRMYNGVNTWICCCNQNLCNGASIATTTYRPAGNTCHFCSTCPLPFNRYSSLVRDTYSPNGWCTVSVLLSIVSQIRFLCRK